ncbi:hypothetical protein DUNSADRAFT_882 [Dunaliella salina]|uniref:Uncharacterized protein n=1 Tax=Dunaliella salina TaxID=3046 RepID=A0ABQ7H8M3_DUNSA|nr:hypothetical protein DUNSADRAFT_882 [Dunaliella salina]|eukprot:KAF5843206.1 hypothetical protein DUNSADRAFT_882 [Dunaliella salina]
MACIAWCSEFSWLALHGAQILAFWCSDLAFHGLHCMVFRTWLPGARILTFMACIAWCSDFSCLALHGVQVFVQMTSSYNFCVTLSVVTIVDSVFAFPWRRKVSQFFFAYQFCDEQKKFSLL